MLEYFIAPSVVALLVLSAQYFVFPRLEREKTKAVELFKHQKDTFGRVIELVDQCINSQNLQMLDQEKFRGHRPTSHPDMQEVNRIYSQLILLAGDQTIPKAFIDFFGPTIGGDVLVKRGELILSLRNELYDRKMALSPEEVGFYYNTNADDERKDS